MIKLFWYFLKGYVTIEIKGATKERFFNMASYKNIFFWDIKHIKNSIQAKISIQDFRKLKEISKKTNCKYKILYKEGLPFLIFRYRKRKILFLGIPFFLFTLYFLTSFVWAIDIVGYNDISYHVLINALDENGLSFGTFKHTINKLEIEEQMLNTFENMSFININLYGTRATVTISENIKQVDIIDRDTPTNLVSSHAAIIHSLNVRYGDAIVTPGDVVFSGDLLVSALVIPDDTNPDFFNYVHATAEIYGYVYYNLDFLVSNKDIEKEFTGRIRSIYTINIINRYVNLPNAMQNFQNYDTIISRTILNFGENYPLPFVLIVKTQKEYIEHIIQRDRQTMEQLAYRKINETILNFFDFDVDIVRKNINLEEISEGLSVSVSLTTLQNIAIEQNVVFYENIDDEVIN
ncbi:MAG: sporulation protein YqfD [Defluviitaleaceae bacterium]|nr:sporulation protein YqfD [Defluviitaleaceae bacterium]